jgi:SPP1 gp7 family putative phage head morphogenesis protein
MNTLVTDVRGGVIEADVFGLRVAADALTLDGDVPRDTLAGDDLPPLVRFDRDERKVDAFLAWLRERLAADVLTVIDRDDNPFVRSAYVRGLKDATRMVRAAGGSATGIGDDPFDMPVRVRSLERLFAASYDDLEDITRALSRAIGEELAAGFEAGEGPRTIARRITDRIDAVGKTRAAVLARTRVIGAHAEATLDRYDELGIDRVSHAEWRTADDDRVCPICKRLDGREIPLGEARSGTFTISEAELGADEPPSNAGTYPLRPPAHPNGRCVLLPVV